MGADKPKHFETPLPYLLPLGKRVLLRGKPVTNAIDGDVTEGVVLCFDYDENDRIVRDEWGVSVLTWMPGGKATIADVRSGN